MALAASAAIRRAQDEEGDDLYYPDHRPRSPFCLLPEPPLFVPNLPSSNPFPGHTSDLLLLPTTPYAGAPHPRLRRRPQQRGAGQREDGAAVSSAHHPPPPMLLDTNIQRASS